VITILCQRKVDTADAKPPSPVQIRAAPPTFLMRRTASAAKNGRYTLQGISATTLSALIQAAYNVKEFQILEAPSWVNSDRYDVDARAPGAATFEQMRPMLQSLLADRFKLTLHRDTRKLPVYELVPAAKGLTIVPMKEGSCVPIEQAKCRHAGVRAFDLHRGRGTTRHEAAIHDRTSRNARNRPRRATFTELTHPSCSATAVLSQNWIERPCRVASACSA
jgi:uncharacterized protein (TIGR03435 family)